MDFSKWKSQFRKGLLEYGLLHLVKSKNEAYGYEIIEGLKAIGMEMTEGTLYPLLSRLTREKVLQPKWELKNVSGHPRKYYELTQLGEDLLLQMDEEWKATVRSIEEIKK